MPEATLPRRGDQDKILLFAGIGNVTIRAEDGLKDGEKIPLTLVCMEK